MTDTYRTALTTEESSQSAVSWAAVVAGGLAAAGLTLILLAFGSGMGLSAVSPWSNSGVSATTFKITAGIYLVVMAMLSSAIGGYIAGRLRTKWVGLHSEEVLFRDTAHGFLAWAFATVLGAAALGAAATFVVGGVATGASQGTAQAATTQTNPTDYFVDMLFRPTSASPAAAAAQAPAGSQGSGPGVAEQRREARIILTRAIAGRSDVSPTDRTYLAQSVSARTGLPQPEAEKRVSDVITQAKAAADEARKAAAKLSMWLAISMLVGAFAASLAAIEGGQLRDGTWRGVIGARNYRGVQR